MPASRLTFLVGCALFVAACASDTDRPVEKNVAGKSTTAAAPATPSSDEPVAQNLPSYTIKSERIVVVQQHPPEYEIAIDFPAIAGDASIPSHNGFNNTVADTMRMVAQAFREEMDEMAGTMEGDSVPSEIETGSSSLTGHYTVVTSRPDLISARIELDQYNEGAAHPSHAIWTFNYDLAANRPIRLADLFKPGIDYLAKLSSYTMNDLRQRLGENADGEMLRGGTAPEEMNFSSFELKEDSLVINFQEYQVGPYAIGPQRVAIPSSELRELLAGRYLK